MSAPSAGNEKPWHFIVIRDEELKQKVSSFSPYSSFAKNANILIVVCVNHEHEKHEGFWVQDLSAATQNMLIEIESLELGTVWLGCYPREDRMKHLIELFDLPENVEPFVVLPIGVPEKHPKIRDNYDKTRIHIDKW